MRCSCFMFSQEYNRVGFYIYLQSFPGISSSLWLLETCIRCYTYWFFLEFNKSFSSTFFLCPVHIFRSRYYFCLLLLLRSNLQLQPDAHLISLILLISISSRTSFLFHRPHFLMLTCDIKL